jgi:TonB family protein
MPGPLARPLAATVLLGLALASGRARAEEPAAPPPPRASVVLPKPTTPLHADYPEGAKGDADVELAVIVNADGSVRGARVLSGDEPFASAAARASSSWRFEPATRAGKPFAATIRAAIHFTAPAPPEAEPPAPPKPGAPPSAAAPPAPAAKPPPAPIDVTVRGEIPAPGVTSLSRAEVRLLPGAFGDPFRAVDSLPGVTPLASGLPFFYVRGAPPGNVGYLLDGIRVPLLYHMGLGPSVIHPALMDRVDLYPGGYPARYGRFAGGIVAGETVGPMPDWHGEASIRLVDAGAMLGGPIDGGRGSVFAAGRVSYTGALFSLVSSDLELGYWDYQARATYDLGPRDTVAVFAFGARDNLSQKDETGSHVLFDTTFHRLDLRYDHRLGGAPEDRFRQAVTLGYDRTGFDLGAGVGDYLLASRTELVKRASEDVLVRAGLDAELDAYKGDLGPAFTDSPGFTALFPDHLDLALGAHADAVIAVTKAFEVTPGLRVDLFASQGKAAVAVDPRLATRLAVTPDLRLVTANGLASQTPSFILPGPGFQPGLEGGLQRSFQSSLGVEADLPYDVTAAATVFEDAFFDMNDALGTAPVPKDGDSFSEAYQQRSLGQSFGLELLVKRRLTRTIGGLLSYTLSRSERRVGRSSVASAFDRTHVANVATSYDLGRGVHAGTRLVFYTGTPITEQAAGTPVELVQSGRMPPFFRFDFRVEKRWTVAKRYFIALVLEVQNAFLAKETIQEQCLGGPSCTPVRIGPVTIPSLGLEAGF